LQDTDVTGLQVITSGPVPPNPADLLASRRMDVLLQQLREQTDIILLNAPPIIAVTDAAVLSTKVDGVLLVVGAGRTRHEYAQRAKALLDKVNARIVGAVLNNAALDTSIYGYYGQTAR